MKISPETYAGMRDDIIAVAGKLGVNVATAPAGETGLKTMWSLLDVVSRNRAYDDHHPAFANKQWPRLLPYDGREYTWYYQGGYNDTHVSTALRQIKQEMITRYVKPFNKFADERAEFSARPGSSEAGHEIVNGAGAVIARTIRGDQTPFEDECNARLMSFAGKLHWALGDASGVSKAAAQDLRVIAAQFATDPVRAAAAVTKVAAELVAAAEEFSRAGDGALLTGMEAAAFDGEWKQPYTSLPSKDAVAAVLTRWAQLAPRPGQPQAAGEEIDEGDSVKP